MFIFECVSLQDPFGHLNVAIYIHVIHNNKWQLGPSGELGCRSSQLKTRNIIKFRNIQASAVQTYNIVDMTLPTICWPFTRV